MGIDDMRLTKLVLNGIEYEPCRNDEEEYPDKGACDFCDLCCRNGGPCDWIVPESKTTLGDLCDHLIGGHSHFEKR